MPLIKSKINSLAWLKSAIYFFVVGGVILSFKPVLAATLSVDVETERYIGLTIKENAFGNGVSPPPYSGKYWKGTFNIEEIKGNPDELVVRVYLQHIKGLHPEDSGLAKLLNLNFRVGGSRGNPGAVDQDFSEHPGVGHFDEAVGVLLIDPSVYPAPNKIKKWELGMYAQHNVPEPTTMLASAVALGWGGWLKRNNSIKQNKTKSRESVI